MSFTIDKNGKMIYEKNKFCPYLNKDNSCKKAKKSSFGRSLDEKIVIKYCMKDFKKCDRYE